MLLRPIEAKIWNDTQKWLHEKEENRLLFIIDEAHMYRGSSGGEVALLIRRLFNKLGINDKVREVHISRPPCVMRKALMRDVLTRDDVVQLSL